MRYEPDGRGTQDCKITWISEASAIMARLSQADLLYRRRDGPGAACQTRADITYTLENGTGCVRPPASADFIHQGRARVFKKSKTNETLVHRIGKKKES